MEARTAERARTSPDEAKASPNHGEARSTASPTAASAVNRDAAALANFTEASPREPASIQVISKHFEAVEFDELLNIANCPERLLFVMYRS